MDNGTMLKKLINAGIEECKELINKYQLQDNKSFIRCLISEYNATINISTVNIFHRNELQKKISKLHLIDSLL